MEWDTILPPEVTASYGLGEMHGAFFKHRADMSDKNPNVVVVILPETGRDVFASAMIDAHNNGSRVAIITDTKEQAEQGAEFAAARLPLHERISVVRASSGGGWGRIQ